jgi:hypothetical protein
MDASGRRRTEGLIMINNPYVGPRAFNYEETLYGRDREVRKLLEQSIRDRILLMYSPSGAGKTSLIQAALIPELKREEFSVLPVMRVNWELSSAERQQVGRTNRYLLSALLSLERASSEQLPLPELAQISFADYLKKSKISGAARVLIFDQFEEILTIDPTDQDAKDAFFDQVGTALRDRELWAIFSMREDYVAGLDPFLRRIPTRLASTFRLDLLTQDTGREAIQKPARRAGVEFQDDAANRLLDDLRAVWVQQSDGKRERHPGPHIEPVQLQVVCRRLWQKLPEDAGKVTLDDILKIGDVNGALAGYYADEINKIAKKASDTSERSIREWFEHRLITDQGLRGQVQQGPEISDGLPNTVIKPLIDAHLVRADKRRGVTWFELAHDRLIEPIQKNNGEWLRDNLNDFQRQAQLWDRQDRPDTLLVYGEGLRVAEAWLEKETPNLTPIETVFLSKCREAREKEREERERATRRALERQQARRNRRIAAVMTVISIIAVAAVVGMGFSLRKWITTGHALQTEQSKVSEEKRVAEEQARLARENEDKANQALAKVNELILNRDKDVAERVKQIEIYLRGEAKKVNTRRAPGLFADPAQTTTDANADVADVLNRAANMAKGVHSTFESNQPGAKPTPRPARPGARPRPTTRSPSQ